MVNVLRPNRRLEGIICEYFEITGAHMALRIVCMGALSDTIGPSSLTYGLIVGYEFSKFKMGRFGHYNPIEYVRLRTCYNRPRCFCGHVSVVHSYYYLHVG